MADNKSDDAEKTEEPTQKRLEDARKKGDIPKSQEVNTWFVMIGITLLIALFSDDAALKLKNLLTGFLQNADSIPMDGDNILYLITNTGISV
ncbi:MAG: EscU/YscU/HrcU family type III secretion system export apparatus switch protein, partial [Emcibacter sp.]|nr:EscU/YscU/HrcU family type III secretion system export apparatus switch protein [Emcibacter sp.]